MVVRVASSARDLADDVCVLQRVGHCSDREVQVPPKRLGRSPRCRFAEHADEALPQLAELLAEELAQERWLLDTDAAEDAAESSRAALESR